MNLSFYEDIPYYTLKIKENDKTGSQGEFLPFAEFVSPASFHENNTEKEISSAKEGPDIQGSPHEATEE